MMSAAPGKGFRMHANAEDLPRGDRPPGHAPLSLAPLWIAMLGVVVLGLVAWWVPVRSAEPAVVAADPAASIAPATDGWAGFAVEPERPAPGFTLTDGAGRPWSLDDARGSVVALFFGYTRCPDVCPQTMSRLQAAVAELGADGDAVRVVLVTTDPEHDTADVMARYVGAYDPRFVGLTGSVNDVRTVGALFGALPGASADGHDEAAAQGDGAAHDDGAARDDDAAHADAPSIDPTMHSSRVWLIDAAGQMRVSYSGPYTPADVAHDMSILIGERR